MALYWRHMAHRCNSHCQTYESLLAPGRTKLLLCTSKVAMSLKRGIRRCLKTSLCILTNFISLCIISYSANIYFANMVYCQLFESIVRTVDVYMMHGLYVCVIYVQVTQFNWKWQMLATSSCGRFWLFWWFVCQLWSCLWWVIYYFAPS